MREGGEAGDAALPAALDTTQTEAWEALVELDRDF